MNDKFVNLFFYYFGILVFGILLGGAIGYSWVQILS